MENLRRYSRRNTLEIQGVPVAEGENTNAIVLKVAQLAVPEGNFDESILSLSHRIPAGRGYTPNIIAKFARRDVRDIILVRDETLSRNRPKIWLNCGK